MKKLLASLLVVFALPLIGRADSVTSRLSLTEPDVNSANWGTKLNNNFGLIDAGVGVLGKSNIWTQTNTFQGPVIISSYTTITSSVAFSTITATLLTATNETVTTLTVLSSATVGTIQGPITVVSSATMTGNAEVDGVFSATGTVTLGSAGRAITMKAPVTATSSATFTSNAEVDGTFIATGSVTLGSAGNAVAISSNEFVGNTTFYAKGSNYSIITDTMSAAQINNQIMRYRRPRLIYVSGTEVDIESGTVGGLTANGSSITAIFPDGAVYSSTGTEASQAVITSTANWGNPLSGGLRLGEKLTGRTWENYYLVKSSAPGDTTHMVVVISSWQPTNANYQQLNTNFCGSGVINCWTYLGVVPYGDNASANNVILKFYMSGNHTALMNVASAVQSVRGVVVAHTAGATNLTWTYASGTDIASAQVPLQLQKGDMVFTSAATTQVTLLDSFATLGAMSFAMSSGGATIPIANWPLVSGFRDNNGVSTAKDLLISGYQDAVLGIGSNPQL